MASPLNAVDKIINKTFVGWTPADVPDFTGKVAMVTGGSSGIGWELVRTLAMKGCKVFMVSRTHKGADIAIQNLANESVYAAGLITVLQCDMSSLKEVDAMSQQFRDTGCKLDLLVLNAGVFFPGPFKRTEDGMEQTLGINYFSQIRLLTNLEDKLLEARPSRIVFTSSHAEFAGRVDWQDLRGSSYTDSGLVPYGSAKLYMLMFAKELQDRYNQNGFAVDVLAQQPGVTSSPILEKEDLGYVTGSLVYALGQLIGYPVKVGAIPLQYTATSPKLTGKGFQYIGPNHLQLFLTESREPLNPAFKRPEMRRRLFTETLDILKQTVGPRIQDRTPKPSGSKPEVYQSKKQGRQVVLPNPKSTSSSGRFVA